MTDIHANMEQLIKDQKSTYDSIRSLYKTSDSINYDLEEKSEDLLNAYKDKKSGFTYHFGGVLNTLTLGLFSNTIGMIDWAFGTDIASYTPALNSYLANEAVFRKEYAQDFKAMVEANKDSFAQLEKIESEITALAKKSNQLNNQAKEYYNNIDKLLSKEHHPIHFMNTPLDYSAPGYSIQLGRTDESSIDSKMEFSSESMSKIFANKKFLQNADISFKLTEAGEHSNINVHYDLVNELRKFDNPEAAHQSFKSKIANSLEDLAEFNTNQRRFDLYTQRNDSIVGQFDSAEDLKKSLKYDFLEINNVVDEPRDRLYFEGDFMSTFMHNGSFFDALSYGPLFPIGLGRELAGIDDAGKRFIGIKPVEYPLPDILKTN